MQLVLIGPLDTSHVEPHEQVTQLRVRQAGSDDRTVKRFRELPYFAASPRGQRSRAPVSASQDIRPVELDQLGHGGVMSEVNELSS
jgi:hypothetical protein